MMPFEGNDDLLKEKQRAQSLKVGLKEKVVQLYERHFSGEDITGSQTGFWEEFFLLRANIRYLQAHFEKCSWGELVCQKPQIHRLFDQSLQTLHAEHAIRRANALQTLSALVRGAFSCRPTLQSLNCVVGPDGCVTPHPNLCLLAPAAAADRLLQELLQFLCNFALDDTVHLAIKALALNLLITMATACDLQYNPLLRHMVSGRVFDCCMHVFASPSSRCEFGESVCTLLALLLQADTHQVANSCLMKLAVLDDNLVLNGFSYVISLCLASYNDLYRQRVKEPRGLLYSITNMVGHILVGEEKGVERIEVQDALLLALFEALHVNRNFIATLTYSHTHQLSMGQIGQTAEAGQDCVPEPTNLLVVFLEYCSIIMQDTRDSGMFNSCKLCFLILIAISEDEYANSLMHDMNMNFRVNLHRIQMRHRAPSLGVDVDSAPLACALLDLLVEFCQSHLMRTFPVELYQYALLIVHRLLCYQKQAEVRLQYSWHHLWSAMFTAGRYALSCFNAAPAQDAQFRQSVLGLLRHACQLLNFFITFGDTFLPSCDVYDLLFYEIIRMRALFDDCYQLCQSVASDAGSSLKEAAGSLERSLSNIRSIIQHFAPRIDDWAEVHGQRCLTQEQVLAVVRANYDSLTLRLFTSLDAYASYQELIPAETAYFRQLTRKIVTSVRKDAFESSQQLQTKLKDLSTLL